MEFLQGLHEHYSNLRSQILLMEPFLTAAKIYALVRQEEKQQEIHSSTPSTTMPEAAALIVNSVTTNGTENQSTPSQNHANLSTNSRGSGHHPNRSSNRYNGNPNQRNIGGDHRQTGKPRMYCDYCDRNNHNQDTCYRLHGYPTDKPRGSSNSHRLSSSSSSGAPRSNDRAMVAAPLITQDQYNNILAMLSSGSINSQANLAGFDGASLQKACCGTGGDYNFNLAEMCGASGVLVCRNPNEHISWDGVHLTQEAYKIMLAT
ncbi:hypothetical protein RHSIM_Rhsim07G0194300 [Rhododendron simsii]|uniref:Uncharacterized protein n=1 Tax=Rhododendron simsii TaxID=118357 RepID=A0A834GPB1_RHOSS|nr:hypothetical protein RHSIM_Rhsim07G0194300 [Rhododendron simsii]